MALTLHSVSAVKATNEATTFIVTCKITDLNSETYECDYVSRAADPFGLNPTIREWLVENSDFPITPYAPPPEPSDEEKRAQMPPLTARQFRLGLLAGGRTPAQVTATIEAMSEGAAKETAKIEWEYATTFKRTHPLIATVGTALGLTPETIDAMWLASANL